MGIIKQGILGGLSGKVGNVVGSSWKGIHYLRSLPSKVTNPRTPAQQTSRKKMELVIKFLKTCTTLVRIGFSAFAVKKSAFNAATSYNYQNAVEGNYPEMHLDFSKLQVSQGNLSPAKNARVEPAGDGQISFSWDDNSDEANANAADIALLLVYNPVTGTSFQSTSSYTRGMTNAVLDLPAGWNGATVHGYIAFADVDRIVGRQLRDCISNSVYAGEAEVL